MLPVAQIRIDIGIGYRVVLLQFLNQFGERRMRQENSPGRGGQLSDAAFNEITRIQHSGGTPARASLADHPCIAIGKKREVNHAGTVKDVRELGFSHVREFGCSSTKVEAAGKRAEEIVGEVVAVGPRTRGAPARAPGPAFGRASASVVPANNAVLSQARRLDMPGQPEQLQTRHVTPAPRGG